MKGQCDMTMEDRSKEPAEAQSQDTLLTIIDIRKIMIQLGIPQEKFPFEAAASPAAEA